MSKLSDAPLLRQADIDRLIKAAAKNDCIVRVDLKSLIATIVPPSAMTEVERQAAISGLASKETKS